MKFMLLRYGVTKYFIVNNAVLTEFATGMFPVLNLKKHSPNPLKKSTFASRMQQAGLPNYAHSKKLIFYRL